MATNPDFVQVGIVIGCIDGTKVNEEVYQGPDDQDAETAYNACRIMKDRLDQLRTAGKIKCGPLLSYKLPVGQQP